MDAKPYPAATDEVRRVTDDILGDFQYGNSTEVPHLDLWEKAKDSALRGAIESVLRFTCNNQSAAAVIMGCNRATLRSHMKRYGLL